jgi:hypothetical protein
MRWGRGRLLIAAVIAALVVVPAVLILAQQRAASAATILSILDGSASVARGAATFVAASDGDIVNTGDRVQTAERSHAMVTFFDGSTLEIEPVTTVQIEEAATAASGAIAIRISQTIGRTWASVQKLTRADSKFELRTPTLTAAVRGTGFVTEVLADGTSSVQTTDGAVQVTGQGQSVLVTAGQTTTAAPSSPPTAPAAGPPSPNRLRFGMHSPAYLAVVDPFGRACGIVLPGPTIVRQIPGCVATAPGSDPQLVDVPSPVLGTYQVVAASIAPGGSFVATASAVDGLGNLSFNYTASGAGQPGAKLLSSIEVQAGPNGTLSARGFGPLVVIEQAPVKVVRAATSSSPHALGTPDTSTFAPLPGIGFATGPNSTITPLISTTPPSLTNAPSVTLGPLPTEALPTAALPTLPLPTALVPPTLVPTVIPSVVPTIIPTNAPTPTPQPAPTPTPVPPTPVPSPPTLSGGSASPGGTLPVLGTSWPPGVAVTISWADGTQVATADAQSDGRIATLIHVPPTALVGTYKITARGGGLAATADVVVSYAPSLSVVATFPPRAGASVPYSGSGWPPGVNYSLVFDGGRAAVAGGVTSVTGTIAGTLTVPANTVAGAHTLTATAGNYNATASLTTQ